MRPLRRSRGWAAAVLVTLLTVAVSIQAKPIDDRERAAAREMGRAAIAAYDAGHYAAALELFERADALVHLSTTGLWTARCLEQLGRWVEASERYLEVTRMSLPPDALPVHRQAQQQAASARQALWPRVPQVVFRVRGASQQLAAELDDSEMSALLLGAPQPVDPGTHVFSATSGEISGDKHFSVSEGERLEVAIELPPASGKPVQQPAAGKPPAAPPPMGARTRAHGGEDAAPPTASPATTGGSGAGAQQIAGWVTIGVGGAGLVLGGITAAMAASVHGNLQDACPDGRCAPEQWSDVDRYDTLRPIASTGLVGGGALLAAGVVVVLTAPAGQPGGTGGLSVHPLLGPGWLGAHGSF